MGLYTPPPPQLSLRDPRSRVNRVWFWAVVERWTVLLLSSDDDDVLLYSSFPLTRMLKGGGGGDREKGINKKKKKTHGTKSFTERVFSDVCETPPRNLLP